MRILKIPYYSILEGMTSAHAAIIIPRNNPIGDIIKLKANNH
jgi:hypothetical protein